MKCALCNNELILKNGHIEITTKNLGKALIPDIQYLECKGCKDKLLTPEQSDKVVDFIKQQEAKWQP